MEDGLGLQVVLGHGGIGQEAAERILLDHASALVGAELNPSRAASERTMRAGGLGLPN